MKLHLGCGKMYRYGYTNVDINKDVKVDVRMDFEHIPWPFKDNTFEEVLAYHVFEHSLNYLGMLEELYRVSKPDALWFVEVPYVTRSIRNLVNPYHHTNFSEHSFDFFAHLKGSANEHNSIKLEVLLIELVYFPEYRTDISARYRLFAQLHYFNVVEAVKFKLRVHKE